MKKARKQVSQDMMEYEQTRRSWPEFMEQLPKDEWLLDAFYGNPVVEIWRSRDFMAIIWESDGRRRMSVQRTRIDRKTGKWRESITWEDLQEVKRQCGFAADWGVEIYPPESQQINVGNMRHLWFVAEKPVEGWEAVRIGKPENV